MSSHELGTLKVRCRNLKKRQQEVLHARGVAEVSMGRFNKVTLVALVPSLIALCGCQDLVPRDTRSLLSHGLHRSEIFGFLAGFGTTFAAVPDLIAMLRRRSSAGMNPRMAAIMGAFQILWVYYGLLIASRPVILWNVVAVLVNFLSVGAYLSFRPQRKKPSRKSERGYPPPLQKTSRLSATSTTRKRRFRSILDSRKSRNV